MHSIPNLSNSTHIREIVAGAGQAGAALGFALALAAGTPPRPHNRALLWVREAAAAAETGEPYGPGLAALQLSSDRLILASVRTETDALRAALEGARCTSLNALVLETVAPLDLTASRRLKLAAEKSGVGIVLVRLSQREIPNAAQIRWRVHAAPSCASCGTRRAAFEVFVLKHPAGVSKSSFFVEWDYDRQCFTETLSRTVAAVPAGGSLAA